MKKGIVMEVNEPYLTLLTSDGEFFRARKMDRLYSIGEEIDFFPATDIKSKKTTFFKNFFTLRIVWMSMAVLVISLGSIIPVYQNNKAYAYMTIDAETSIEMGLNKNMQVVELKGFNEEAEKIISQLDDWKKKDASELTAIIVAELKDEGFIASAEPVLISTVKTEQLKNEAAAKLQENIDEIKQTVDKHLVEVNMYTTTEAELEKAQDSGVPVGVYHRNKSKDKNDSAEKKQNKEKIKPAQMTTEPAANTTLPPGQKKKQEEQNTSNQNQNQTENNQNNTPIVKEQGNVNQNPPGLNKEDKNSGNEEKQDNNKGNQKANNKINKQEKPKTNNENKVKKDKNNGK